MARGRFISKAISLDERVDALSSDTVRLLFTWLIPHLDCEGRMYGDPQTVKSIVFPRRSMDVRTMQKYLDELVKTGLVQRYVNGGSTFLYFPNFGKHQPGLNKNKEAPSEIPPFTPELVGSNDGVSPAQVKVQVKDKVQVKVEDKDTPLIPPVSCISPNKEELRVTNLETVLSAYRENILCGDTIPEDMEADLKAAVQRFSADWVIDAIKEACRANKSYWYYIAGILKNWQRYGKGANFPSKEAQ